MKKKNFVYVGIVITAISIIVGLGFSLNTNNEKFYVNLLPELEFTYNDSNSKLKQHLDSKGISMSSPVKLYSQKQINEFCTFFDDESLQNQVEYCTSTELLDSEGNYLGNIHMVGNRLKPKMVLSLIQSDPFWENLNHVKTVYGIVIEDLVCNCWNEIKPSGIDSVSEWIEKQREFHTSDTKPTSKSALKLSEKHLQMELTTNPQGYLWKLLISG